MENLWYKKIYGRNEKVKLFCFPHAGAGAYIYNSWKNKISSDIGLYAVQLPGREKRIRDALVDDAQLLCKDVVENIKNEFDKPYVIFGHSMGGILAYETLLQIIKNKLPLPKFIIMSATSLEGFNNIPNIDDFNDDELAHYLLEIGGTSSEVLENDGFRECFFPIIRNDYRLVRNYKSEKNKVPVPIVALAGTEDIYAQRHKLASLEKITDSFKLIDMEGGHFFIEDTKKMCRLLEELVLE